MSMGRQSPEEAATLEADAFTAPATSVLLAVSLATAAESTTLITSRFAAAGGEEGWSVADVGGSCCVLDSAVATGGFSEEFARDIGSV